MRKIYYLLIIITSLISLTPTINATETSTFEFDFNNSESAGWTSSITDVSEEYASPQRRETYQFEAGISDVIIEKSDKTKVREKAFKLAVTNRSDDAFPFMYRQFNLKPNHSYKIQIDANLYSDVCEGDFFGSGGHPDSSIFIQYGALSSRPQIISDHLGNLVLVQKGLGQAPNRTDFLYVGPVGTGVSCPENKNRHDFFQVVSTERIMQRNTKAPFTQMEITNGATIPKIVTSDQEGNIWIIVGWDSAFEARTTTYFDDIKITFIE